MKLTVTQLGPNMASVSGPGVPIATYRLDDDGTVRQYQFRRGKDCWVSVHSERIIEAVQCAFGDKGRYATVNLMTGELSYIGDADSPQDACKRASGTNVQKVVEMKGAFGVYKLPEGVDTVKDVETLQRMPHMGNYVAN